MFDVASPTHQLVLHPGGYRTWGDGSMPASCQDYLMRGAPYDYGGASGDGTYRLKVGEAEFDVHCDMTQDGGGWTWMQVS